MCSHYVVDIGESFLILVFSSQTKFRDVVPEGCRKMIPHTESGAVTMRGRGPVQDPQHIKCREDITVTKGYMYGRLITSLNF